MKQFKASSTTSIRTVHVVILVAALAIAAAAAVSTTNAKPVSVEKPASAEKPRVLKPVSYKSRDYGVSFAYPWQYEFVNAKTIAESSDEASLRPKSDGHDSEMTLARIDIPKGDYEGTNFESGYFTLSLDPKLTESECKASFHVLEGGKIEKDTVNGVGFDWIDIETEDGGEASKVRQYKTYSNGTCYEVEMGVKTHNQDGLAQEVNPDSVMLRLDSILRTMQIGPNQKTVTVETASSKQNAK